MFRLKKELLNKKAPRFGAFFRTGIWGDFRIYERSTGLAVHPFLDMKVSRLKDKEGFDDLRYDDF